LLSFQHQNSSIEFLILSFSFVQDCPPISSGEIVLVGVGEGEGDGVGVGDGEADSEGVGEGLALGSDAGIGFLIATPLFQTNILPDFMQVYLIPDVVEVAPSLLQAAPGLTAAIAIGSIRTRASATARTARNFLRM
jgi:hypothetical protein